jgi:hypothetical protein
VLKTKDRTMGNVIVTVSDISHGMLVQHDKCSNWDEEDTSE